MSNKFSALTKAPVRGEPIQFDRNGQTLTVEWNYYPAEPSNNLTEEVTVAGIYDIHNDEVPFEGALYDEAIKAIFATR